MVLAAVEVVHLLVNSRYGSNLGVEQRFSVELNGERANLLAFSTSLNLRKREDLEAIFTQARKIYPFRAIGSLND